RTFLKSKNNKLIHFNHPSNYWAKYLIKLYPPNTAASSIYMSSQGDIRLYHGSFFISILIIPPNLLDTVYHKKRLKDRLF
ncbi:MAG: hypothetical protein R6U91_10210, partial [Bacillota bacterium]